jgi:hypothetical protein
MNNFCSQHDIKKLYILLCTHYGHKFNSFHTPDLIRVWYQEWYEGLLGLDKQLVFEACNYFKTSSIWPPSLAEIILFCDEKLGLPNQYEAVQMIISRNFSHPILTELYQFVGDWAFKNDSEKELMRKVKAYYPKIVSNFKFQRQNKAYCLEHKPREVAHDTSHGSEVGGDNIRRVGMRQAKDHLLS